MKILNIVIMINEYTEYNNEDFEYCNIDHEYTRDGYNNPICKFIIDSGASEHLSNLKLMFKNLDTSVETRIKCVNTDPKAGLRSRGIGNIIGYVLKAISFS